MPSTPTLTLCDQLVAALLASWTDRGTDDGAERAYFKRFGTSQDPVANLKGRRVVIFPAGYDNGPADRGEDEYEHRVTVQVLEPFEGEGDPDVDWVDARVDFVFELIVQGFDFSRESPAWNPKLWTKTAEVRIADAGHLSNGTKVFFSQVDLAFGEIRDA